MRSPISQISIIIPTLNEQNYLPSLLNSLAQQTYSGELEIIVVDGHSTDDTVRVAREFENKFSDLSVVEADKDVGHQRNVGASKAKYEHLIFADADVIFPPTLLEDLAKRMPREDRFIVSLVHTAEVINWQDRVFLVVGHIIIGLAWLTRTPGTVGDFILTTRTNHDAIGGFKEGAILGEDVDYGLRSIRTGAKYYFFWRQKIIASPRRVRQVGRVRLLVLWTKGYWHVVRKGPIYAGEGYEYNFGHHGDSKSDK